MKLRCRKSFSLPYLFYIIVFQSATPGSSRDEPPVERWLCLQRDHLSSIVKENCSHGCEQRIKLIVDLG